MSFNHLGGHFNRTHLDEGSLLFIIKEFNIKSFLDIGCGPMGMVVLAKRAYGNGSIGKKIRIR